MNKMYYPAGNWYSKEAKDKFYEELKMVKDNTNSSIHRFSGSYSEFFYVLKNGDIYRYMVDDDYGIPYLLEKINYEMGINVNCDDYDFCDWIARGLKTVETRNTPSLRKYIGKRVAIVSTRPGHKEKARVIGYATISKEITYSNSSDFYADSRHMIKRHMKKYRFNKVKYGYVLSDFKSAKGDKMIYTNGIVSRKVEVE